MAQQRIVALEEHFAIPAISSRFEGFYKPRPHQPYAKLDDLGNQRIADMNVAGIDVQVLSHVQPSTQAFDAKTSADELERCILKLDFKGAMVSGLTQNASSRPPRSCAR
jgi:hypothetical protein